MMRNSFKLKLRNMFLLWTIINMNFWVKGAPALTKVGNHITEETKIVKDPDHTDNLLKHVQLQSANAVNRIEDGTNLGRSTDLGNVRASSEDPKVVDNSQTNGMEMKDRLMESFSDKEEIMDLKYLRVIDLDPIFKSHKLFDWNVKFLKPSQLKYLSTDETIRYVAERDTILSKEVMKLYKIGKEYERAEENAFGLAIDGKDGEGVVKGMERDLLERGRSGKDAKMVSRITWIYSKLKTNPSTGLEQAVQKLQEARKSYLEVYRHTVHHIINSVLWDRFTSGEILKLTDKQYVRKAALYDKDTNKNHGQWLKNEKSLRELVKSTRSKLSPTFIRDGEQILKSKIDETYSKLIKELKLKGKEIDEISIQDLAEREIIKKEAKGSEYQEFHHVGIREIERLEKITEKFKRLALRSADKFYKGLGVLKSSELKYKAWSFRKFFKGWRYKGWTLTNFFKRLFPWFF
ncbi:uncharacterized protein MELLADRAFT_124204 [Melampsora larici-populina 98AG31]|uniref:Secreted protein n=1 Tax=Melampsora larici-populina (strain 98AG31 / pathotype 3-4-7) TaxID=747676 RepID=F4RW28_MELLP|nr:uncharacterized protein MELLADRAFT_124204 [Melampsora larici-populina 98AG31]EGG03462.1 secreted protein [Melampsora larici-populina 98AG31]